VHLRSHSPAVCLAERAEQVGTTEKCCHQRNMCHLAFLAKENSTTDINWPMSLVKSYTPGEVQTSPAF
jgi:hypothetical protein